MLRQSVVVHLLIILRNTSLGLEDKDWAITAPGGESVDET